MQVANYEKSAQSAAVLNSTSAKQNEEEAQFKGLLDELKSQELAKDESQKLSTDEALAPKDESASKDTKTQALELLQSLLVDGQSGEKLEFNTLAKSEQKDLLEFVEFSLELFKKLSASTESNALSKEQDFSLSITQISFTKIEFSSYAQINFGDFTLGKNFNNLQGSSFKASFLELESWFFEAKSEEASAFAKSVEDFLKEDIVADESAGSNALSYTQKALIDESSKPKSALNELLV